MPAPAVTSEREPVPFTVDSLDVYLRRSGGGGGGIYLAVLSILAAALAALPLVQVPVSVRAAGYLRASADPHSIAVPAEGEVVWARSRMAANVRAGDTLLLLTRPGLGARKEALRFRRASLEEEGRDLVLLISWIDGAPSGEPTGVRHGFELRALQTELTALLERESSAEREAARAAELLARGLVARAEVAVLVDRVEELRAEQALLRVRTVSRWRSELAAVREALESLAPESELLESEERRLAVVSPVPGTVDDIAPLAPGSFVSAGQQIATISPESEIIAELYVAPKDIGLIDFDSEVRLQLDAYRFSEWGAMTGKIIEVSGELVRKDGVAAGRVLVSPAAATISGPTGEADLRRGASVSARIPVARRSLWSLLRDSRGRAERLPGEAPVPGTAAG